MDMCKELWSFLKPNESSTIRVYERQVYYFWNTIMFIVFLSVTSFILTAHFMRLPPKVNNGTNLKMLPFRFYVDVEEEPLFTVVCIFQGIVTYSIAIVNSGMEASGFYLVLIACGYIRTIQYRLISLTEIQDRINQNNLEKKNNMSEVIYNDIRNCVIFHQRVMVYCEEVERFMRSIYFVAVFTTIYNISILALNLLMTEQQTIKYMTVLAINVFQFFFCQLSPQYLLMESSAIANAAYFASLKQIGKYTQINQMLHFLMLRGQKPIQLTAGGYLNLSLETFGFMIKNAFSFFAVLRKFSI